MQFSLRSLVYHTLFALIGSSIDARGDAFEETLVRFAAPFVKTVSPGREIHLYHYTEKSGDLLGAPIRATDGRVRSYLGYLRDSTYRPGASGSMAGGGIYAAIDPIASADYGGNGKDWLLVQFVLSPGVRFLDVSSPDTAFPFGSELMDGSSRAGCPARSLIKIWQKASLAGCRALRDRLVQRLAIGAIAYLYTSSPILPYCKARPPIAFVLFGDDALNWDRQLYFDGNDSRGDGHDEMRLILNEILRPARSAPRGWKSLDASHPETDLGEWISRNLMGCGNFPEDQWRVSRSQS